MTQPDESHRSGLSTEDYETLIGFVGDWRDNWWDDDYLRMMAAKWGVDDIGSVLDVGCGVGHWGQRLMTLLSDEATLTGIDAEPRWMPKATSPPVPPPAG